MSDAVAFERCVGAGGVIVFAADTVYGLACSATDEAAVRRLYALKGRPLDKPSAVMFFSLEAMLSGLPELGLRVRSVCSRLLPGGVSLLVPNPARRFGLACGSDPATLGVRVPLVPALAGVGVPVLQSSANLAGGPDPVRLDDVPASLRFAADLVIDGGELPGTPSTVIDLRALEVEGRWRVVRAGAVATDTVAAVLEAVIAEVPPPIPVTVTVQAEPYESPAGQTLRGELHAELARRYGAGQSGDPVRPRVDPAVEAAGELFVARDGKGQPVGCVVLRRYAEAVFELRRMYVRPEARGHGVAAALLAALEDRARQRGAERIILECGTAQPEALAFYQGHGYRPVPRFGIYADSPRSRCFGRELAET